MGALCSTDQIGAVDDDPNLIIDVEKVLADTTWRAFRISHGKIERRFLKRKNYEIQVPMQYYHFEEVEHQIVGRTRRQPGSTGLGKGTSQSHMAGKGLAHGDQTSPGQLGLETEFNNDTDEKQTYTFQFEKVRTASVEVTYQKGFSIGAKANFSVAVPKVLGDGSIGMEMDKHVEVSKATGERFEESLKTSATSDIVVSERSRYIASVVMEERSLLANFKTVVEMSMPAKKAPIFVKDLRTGETNFVRTICNLYGVFKGKADPVPDADGRNRPDVIRFTVEGIIDGVQLATHKINLYCDTSLPPVSPGQSNPSLFPHPAGLSNSTQLSAGPGNSAQSPAMHLGQRKTEEEAKEDTLPNAAEPAEQK